MRAILGFSTTLHAESNGVASSSARWRDPVYGIVSSDINENDLLPNTPMGHMYLMSNHWRFEFGSSATNPIPHINFTKVLIAGASVVQADLTSNVGSFTYYDGPNAGKKVNAKGYFTLLPVHTTLQTNPLIYGQVSYRIVDLFDGHVILNSNLQTADYGQVKCNATPKAIGAAVATSKNTPVPIKLNANDLNGYPLTYTITTPPAHGTVSGTPPSVIYTPAPNYIGADRFIFQARDPSGYSTNGTISITVTSGVTG